MPEGTGKVPIVIYTHSSGGPGDYVWDDFVYHAAQNLLKGIGKCIEIFVQEADLPGGINLKFL